MKKMRMCFPREKTFEDGFKEYVLDCKARSLRDGTIRHYWLWSDLCNSRKNYCGVYLGLYALITASRNLSDKSGSRESEREAHHSDVLPFCLILS